MLHSALFAAPPVAAAAAVVDDVDGQSAAVTAHAAASWSAHVPSSSPCVSPSVGASTSPVAAMNEDVKGDAVEYAHEGGSDAEALATPCAIVDLAWRYDPAASYGVCGLAGCDGSCVHFGSGGHCDLGSRYA